MAVVVIRNLVGTLKREGRDPARPYGYAKARGPARSACGASRDGPGSVWRLTVLAFRRVGPRGCFYIHLPFTFLDFLRLD